MILGSLEFCVASSGINANNELEKKKYTNCNDYDKIYNYCKIIKTQKAVEQNKIQNT